MILERMHVDLWELEAYAEATGGLGEILEIRKQQSARSAHLRHRCVPPDYLSCDVVPFLLYKQAGRLSQRVHFLFETIT